MLLAVIRAAMVSALLRMFLAADAAVACCAVQTGQVKEEKEIHEKQINDMKMAVDGTHFVTASSDKTAKLVDTQTLEVGLRGSSVL